MNAHTALRSVVILAALATVSVTSASAQTPAKFPPFKRIAAPAEPNAIPLYSGAAPGGAFPMLSMDNEGWPVARALADRGIAAFVLEWHIVATALA